MAYRDVSESLRAYRDRVASDLEEARQAAKKAAEQASKVSVLESELAETEGLLAKMAKTGGKRGSLPLLEDVKIAAPCTASWETMVGDEHVRFCGQCEKNVYNLSSLPREEAEALLTAREGAMCVRLFKRADGTVLTSDCPVGVTRRRRRRAAIATVGGGLMAAAAAMGVDWSPPTLNDSPVAATMGSAAPVALQGKPAVHEVPPVDFGRAVMGSIATPPPQPPLERKGNVTMGHPSRATQ